jgi:hypothetical protein
MGEDDVRRSEPTTDVDDPALVEPARDQFLGILVPKPFGHFAVALCISFGEWLVVKDPSVRQR